MVKVYNMDNIKSRHYLHKTKEIQVKKHDQRAKKLSLKDVVYMLYTLTY